MVVPAQAGVILGYTKADIEKLGSSRASGGDPVNSPFSTDGTM